VAPQVNPHTLIHSHTHTLTHSHTHTLTHSHTHTLTHSHTHVMAMGDCGGIDPQTNQLREWRRRSILNLKPQTPTPAKGVVEKVPTPTAAERPERIEGLSPESQGQNLVLTV